MHVLFIILYLITYVFIFSSFSNSFGESGLGQWRVWLAAGRVLPPPHAGDPPHLHMDVH